jgi:TusA-related sulfurtransferase
MQTRQAINELSKGMVEVLVDSGTARDNVSRLGKKSGWAVTVEEQPGGNYRIVLQK